MRGAVLQQAVGEAAGRGADVEATAPLDRNAERGQGVLQLDAAARDVPRRRVDGHLHRGVHELARLRRTPPVGSQADLAGEHGGSRAGARLEEAALGEQAVEPDTGHRANASGRSRKGTG